MSNKKAVVIGAGLGGLSAAAHLAKNGFQVDLFERHHSPGGYACSFVRDGFEFEAALHELSGIGPEGNRGSCYRLLEACDVAQRVEFLPVETFYTSRFPDFEVTVPVGWEEAEEAYSEKFPSERKGIRRLLTFMRRISDELAMLTSEDTEVLDYLTFPVKGSHLIRSLGLTVSQAMDREISDPRLKALFTNVWGYYGLPPSRLSFLLFAVGNAAYLKYGPYHIRGYSQALSNAFVDAIEENGGTVHFRSAIEEIKVSGKKVTGVVTEHGDEFEADYIVSNANPILCCYKLIGERNVPDKFLKALAQGHTAVGTFNVYMGLDCTADELGLKHHEYFINDGYDLEEAYRSMSRIEKQYYYVITTYNATDPECSPPGTAVVVLTGLHYSDAWSRIPPAQYADAKDRMAADMIGAADEVVPGLKDHIKVAEVATPITNMRYTGNPGGSILGTDYDVTGSPALRMGNRGPLEGLFFANAWVRTGGGFEPCITSGFLAFLEIMKDEKGPGNLKRLLTSLG